MNNMKKTIKYAVLFVLFMTFAFVYSHIDKLHPIYNEQVDNSEYLNTGILLDTQLVQTFTMKENTLDGLRIKCVTVGETSDSEIVYLLKEKKTGQILRKGNVNGIYAENNKFLNLDFETIENCNGREYQIIFQVEGTEGNGIGFYLENSGKDMAYTVDGEQQKGTLIIRTVTHKFDLETFFIVILFELYFVVFIKIMYKLFK